MLLLSLSSIALAAPEKPRTLTQNAPIERELLGGQRHSYTVNLKARQIARIVVAQRGVDVVVAVIGPAGKTLFEVDGLTGAHGDETATIVAPQAGAYGIEIRGPAQASPGKYEIRLDRYLSETEYTTEKLAALGRLWGMVEYFHPYLAYKDIDWDGALIEAIPRVKAARTPNEYREAIKALLASLGDPATTAELPPVETDGEDPASDDKKEPVFFRAVGDTVIIIAVDWAKAFMTDRRVATSKQSQLIEEVGKAKGVVLDCRGIPGDLQFFLDLSLDSVLPLLVQGMHPFGTARYRVHNGYPPQSGGTSGGYSSSLVTDAPRAIVGRAPSAKPLVVVIDAKTPDLIERWSGLQGAGAKLLQVGAKDVSGGGRFHQVPMLDGVTVRMRVAEFVHPNGGSDFEADAQMPADAVTDEKVMSAATAMLDSATEQERPPASTEVASAAPTLRSPKDDPYPDMSFPSEEYRLLALFRFWNVIDYFYPYKHLTDRPWSTVLPDFIPRFIEDKSGLEYEMTVAEMVARLQDSHGFVGGFKALPAHLGASAPPIGVGAVGGKLVVTSVLDPAAADAAGIKLGDVVVAIDGQPTSERIAYLSKFKALSTTQSGHLYIDRLALRGAADSKAKLRVETADGQTREIELARTVSTDKVAFPMRRTTPIYAVLPSGYGYIDLGRLPAVDAQQAMDAVMSTRAVIFDMRGYPNGTAWEIAPRLTEKTNVTAALFRRPFQSAAILSEEGFEGATPDLSFEQKLPPAQGAIYKGKVVMLINENAISQAEHTCLFFEAATNVTFIGSPTNGANGDVTNLVLPGAIYVSFSGHDVRHADGRQLQRVGVQPDVRIDPTIAGIREGRDELLDGAIKFLDQH
jgi:C-terminal processing protease CtpA/Prc